MNGLNLRVWRQVIFDGGRPLKQEGQPRYHQDEEKNRIRDQAQRMKLIGSQRAGHDRCRGSKDYKSPPWFAPMTDDHYHESCQRENECRDEKTAQGTLHVMARVAVSINQEVNDAKVRQVSPDESRRDLLPRRIRLDI